MRSCAKNITTSTVLVVRKLRLWALWGDTSNRDETWLRLSGGYKKATSISVIGNTALPSPPGDQSSHGGWVRVVSLRHGSETYSHVLHTRLLYFLHTWGSTWQRGSLALRSSARPWSKDSSRMTLRGVMASSINPLVLAGP